MDINTLLLGLYSHVPSLYTWGDNSFGLVGNSKAAYYYSWVSITSGDGHSVAIRSDSTLWAWGNNYQGQLGDGTTVSKSSPVQISSSSWTAVFAGKTHTLGIDKNYSLYAWGSNYYGQLGDIGVVDRSLPTLISQTTSFIQISAGENYSLAIDSSYRLYAWGSNYDGQLGLFDTILRSSPVQISGSFISISAGEFHSMALDSTSKLYTWGRNDISQLGDSTTISRSSPVQIGTNSWSIISAGGSHSLAINTSNKLFTWGDNQYGQLGKYSTYSSLYWSQVVTGDDHILAVRYDGKLFALGLNSSGQLGDNTTINRSSPVQIGNSFWSSISAGNIHSTGITVDGLLYVWGNNSNSELGTLNLISYSSPVQITGGGSWIAVSSGTHNLAISSYDYGLYGWGTNTYGQVGGQTSTIALSWKSMSIGDGGYVAAISPDNLLFTWGLNSNGVLGNNSTGSGSNPPAKIGNSSWLQVSAGGAHVLAIDSDGYLWGWGLNSSGQIRPDTPFSWITVSTGNNYSAAIRQDGRLYAWGYNFFGNLGDNTTTLRSSPTQIGSLSWVFINTGSLRTGGITNSNKLYVWGRGVSYANGTGNLSDQLSPMMIIWPKSFVSVSSGDSFGIAVSSDFNLYRWGTGQAALGLSGITGYETVTSVRIPTSEISGVSTYWSVYQGYSNGVTLSATDANYSIGASDNFTIEFWAFNIPSGGSVGLKHKVIGNADWWVTLGNSGYTSGWAFSCSAQNDGNINAYGNTTGVAAPSDTWHHIAFVRNSALNTYYVYLDGVLTATTPYAGAAPIISTLTNITLMESCNAYISNLRFTKAIVYSGSSFTVPTSPLTNISNTVILAFQSSSLTTDYSSNAVTFTVNGDPSSFLMQMTNEFYPSSFGSTSVPTSYASATASANGVTAITTDGKLWSWGINNTGQLGLNDTINRSSPVQIGSDTDWSYVNSCSGTGHTIALKNNGTLYVWGTNTSGQLGLDDTINRSQPVQVPGSWISVKAGFGQTLAIDTNYLLWAWGTNAQGQLGDATIISRSSPIQIGSSSWNAISAGVNSLGILTDSNNLLQSWGTNQYGSIGDFSLVYRSAPTQVGFSLTAVLLSRSSPVQIGTDIWKYVSAGDSHSVGIKTDNQLYTWGNNSNGQLGDGTTTNKSSPTQIGNLSWTSIRTGRNYTAAITGSTLYVWGENNAGQLGDNTTIKRSSPVQVSGSWNTVEASTSTTYAISSDTYLYGWGSNLSGRLGDNTTIDRSSPIQIGTNIYTVVNAGSQYVMAQTSDNVIYSWGNNSFGNFGDGTTISRSSPVQVQTGSLKLGYANRNLQLQAIDKYGHTVFVGQNSLYWQLPGAGTSLARSNPVQVYNTTNSSFYSYPARLGISSWTFVSAGQSFSAAIRSDGGLFAWGNNSYGNLGNSGTTIGRSSPVQLGTSSWVMVTAGISQAAAIKVDNTLWTWGTGLLGNNATTTRSSPAAVDGTYNNVVVGDGNILAVRENNDLWGWGFNKNSELGIGDTVQRSSPIQIPSLKNKGHIYQLSMFNQQALSIDPQGTIDTWGYGIYGTLYNSPQYYSWTSLSAGDFHNIGIRNDGQLIGWGLNNVGQLGIGTTVNRSWPTFINAESWIVISSGSSYTAAIKAIDNSLWIWGTNAAGQLGDNTTINKSSPVQISGSWISVSAGLSFTLAIKSDYTLWSWGLNFLNQLGDGTTFNKSSPVQISSSSWSAINAGGSHAIALTSNNKLYGWGANTSGQVGDVTRNSWTQVASGGGTNFFALRSSGELYGWGHNTNASLGLSSTATGARSSPAQIGTPDPVNPWVYVSSAYRATLAIKSDGSLWAWGYGASAGNSIFIGFSNSPNVTAPALVPTTSSRSWSMAAVHESSAAIIATDGTLWVWGANGQGYLGLNDRTARTSPTQILGSWNTVSVNGTSTIAIRNDNTLWSWGDNSNGQLGLNDLITRSSPVQIGTESDWDGVSDSGGSNFTFAIKTNGALYGWGLNTAGQLGLNDLINRSSPVQVDVGSSFIQIAKGTGHIAAIKSDNTLWVWGENNNGQLGQNDLISRSSPTQVGTNSYIMVATLGDPLGVGRATLAISTTNILWSWGGAGGFLGLNDAIARSSPTQIGNSFNDTLIYSPTQIGTDSWSQISAGQTHSAAINSSGLLFTWGLNTLGQLGDGTLISRSSPFQVGSSSWMFISSGDDFTSGITTDYAGFAWGQNNFGQLGQNNTVNRSSPVITSSGSSFSIVTSGFSHSLNVRAISDFGVLGSGYGATGQFGIGAVLNRSQPVQVSVAVTVSTSSPIVLLSSIYPYESSPVQIGTNDWAKISAGSTHSLGTNYNNLLFAWGQNNYGQLGNNDILNRSSPVQINSRISNISSGYSFSSIINENNQAYLFGQNNFGQIGDLT